MECHDASPVLGFEHHPGAAAPVGVEPIDLDSDDSEGGDLLDRVQRWDLETLLAEGLLTKADRASMSSALELLRPSGRGVMEFAKELRVMDRVRGFRRRFS